ncbi:MAG: hypothetical protein WD875_18630 [Pirellulales bacterium]
MNANLTLYRVWPLVLLLAAIALVLHASQAASGEQWTARAAAATSAEPRCSLRTWCEGCPVSKPCHCDDYCPKSAPCVRPPNWCWHCPDYDAKCPPPLPCRVAVGCTDDYCPKPCPACPSAPR